MFVRTASKRDLPAVRSLLVETWHNTYDTIYGRDRVTTITDEWHSLTALEKQMQRPNSEFLVADDGTRIGGMAFAAMEPDAPGVLKLYQLYVLPSLQGRGIGGSLLDETESCFPEATTLKLEVVEENVKAVAFYLAQGFSQTSRSAETDNSGVTTHALVLERAILWAD